MIKVIINASPIIGLCKIGLETIIFDIFDEIYLPDEVIDEIFAKEGKEKEFITNAIESQQIIKYSVKQKDMIEKLYGKMHKGELSVIIAGIEIDADFVIIDDLTARNFATSLSLNPLGMVGILIIAKRKNFIDKITPYLYKLLENGIWISDKLFNKITKIDDE